MLSNDTMQHNDGLVQYARNQRGGAMMTATAMALDEACAGDPQWYVLWTRSHCEQQVHDQLRAKGYEAFLPRLGQWSRRAGLRYLAQVPMFPGYLFLRHAMSKTSYLAVCKTKGLVRILGERWDRLGTVPDADIAGIRAALESDLPLMPHPYVCTGQR